MSKDSFFFPLYVADFIEGTTHMTTEEIGAYMLLLCYQFKKRSIPIADKELIARIAKTNIDLKYVLQKFPAGINQKMSEVLADISEKSNMARQSSLGKWGHGKSVRSQRLTDARKLGRHTKQEWDEMLLFFDNTCVKCGSKEYICKDHITPIYQGGCDSIVNLQPLCKKCNSAKGSENIDHRINYCLRNACEMPAKWVLSKDKAKVKVKDKDNIYKEHTTEKSLFNIPEHFKKAWEHYPKRIGRKEAERHFRTSVKNKDDFDSLMKAMDNYDKYRKTHNIDPQYIKHGSTWFNNWTDWINYKEPTYKSPALIQTRKPIDADEVKSVNPKEHLKNAFDAFKDAKDDFLDMGVPIKMAENAKTGGIKL